MSQDEVAGGFLGCIPGVGQSLQAAELWLVESGAITFWLAVSSAGVTGSGWALLLLRGATGESSSDEGVGAARAVVGAALESGSDFSGSKYSLVVSVLVRPSRCETTIVRVRISKMAAIGRHSWWSNIGTTRVGVAGLSVWTWTSWCEVPVWTPTALASAPGVLGGGLPISHLGDGPSSGDA